MSEMTNDGLESEDAGNRQRLLIAGGLAAAVVLGGGGFLLLSGGSDDVPSGLVTPGKRPAAAATPNASAAPVVLPAVSDVPLGRDPFKALYVLPVPAASPAAGGGDTPPSTTGGAGSTAGGSAGSGSSATYALKLTRVYGTGKDRTASFSVGGKTQLAKVGSVFGATSELKLLSLSQNDAGKWVATLQVGDAEPVDTVAGATLYVR